MGESMTADQAVKIVKAIEGLIRQKLGHPVNYNYDQELIDALLEATK
jgi:hypothetical protein